ncbi:unnamed protein product [Closterium sp. NIES-64]|nr:unnamed protein product [Closterium sp. NIES-64]
MANPAFQGGPLPHELDVRGMLQLARQRVDEGQPSAALQLVSILCPAGNHHSSPRPSPLAPRDGRAGMLQLARQRVDEGQPTAALQLIIALLREQGGKAAVLATMCFRGASKTESCLPASHPPPNHPQIIAVLRAQGGEAAVLTALTQARAMHHNQQQMQQLQQGADDITALLARCAIGSADVAVPAGTGQMAAGGECDGMGRRRRGYRRERHGEQQHRRATWGRSNERGNGRSRRICLPFWVWINTVSKVWNASNSSRLWDGSSREARDRPSSIWDGVSREAWGGWRGDTGGAGAHAGGDGCSSGRQQCDVQHLPGGDKVLGSRRRYKMAFSCMLGGHQQGMVEGEEHVQFWCRAAVLCTILRVRSYGCDPMGAILWVRSYGCDPMGAILWVRSYGCDPMGAILWVRSYGCDSMGAILWVRSYGCDPMGAILWVRSYGCDPTGAILWVQSYGCDPMGAILWVIAVVFLLDFTRLECEAGIKGHVLEHMEWLPVPGGGQWGAVEGARAVAAVHDPLEDSTSLSP